ncbi:MAG TPA: DUF4212 domain-containing protein [Herbaspirillum sp.]|uniref:DUF4212 domain-containing protein n=1 Tax=Herbaspirillum sp. TaxID=1890675 RepID=UPI002D6F7C0A|nr:DUF4212 domain-containing protein [Herbaspirillum sp.]HZG22163.1 DUF4212 domain-containing protein [Herbaspirillum sp.]
MDQGSPAPDPGNQWHRTRRMTGWLLALWFLATFFFIYFARELDQVHLFGWPISFYMAAQGMMLIYLAIVVIYVRRMRRIEQLVRREQGEPWHGE